MYAAVWGFEFRHARQTLQSKIAAISPMSPVTPKLTATLMLYAVFLWYSALYKLF